MLVFTCSYSDFFASMSLLYIKQQVRNDKAVVEALKGLEQKSFRNAKRVVVQDVDYNILTFEEQILTDLNTDVMIGPHGAGMSLFWYCVGIVLVPCAFFSYKEHNGIGR